MAKIRVFSVTLRASILHLVVLKNRQMQVMQIETGVIELGEICMPRDLSVILISNPGGLGLDWWLDFCLHPGRGVSESLVSTG
jgi:hypothetical protein